MRYILIMCLALGISSCTHRTYYGYVYDFDTKSPLRSVAVEDYMNNKRTVTDAKGYFSLKHDSQVSGELIFKKTGYVSDTLKAIVIHNGEQQQEQFKGDTLFLFNTKSNFRDSIRALNN